MKYDIALLKADILDELSKIEKLIQEYMNAYSIINSEDIGVPFYDRAAIGYILHGFYNGCENVFRSIARFFENELNPQEWHRDLLRRMRLEIPGFRPKVIDDKLFALLDEFRGFRHKFRHSYSFDLDWEKERAVALKLPEAFESFKLQIHRFLGDIDQIGDE